MSNVKTREIEVWVNEEDINGLLGGMSYQSIFAGNKERTHTIKAKLIIDIPEKKIEITQSQLDEIIKDAFEKGNDTVNTVVGYVRYKLFDGKE